MAQLATGRLIGYGCRPLGQGLAAMVVALIALATPQAQAQAPERTLMERLTPNVLDGVSPGTQAKGPEGGAPPAVPVYMDGQLVGYVYSTLDVVAAPGYSSVPFDVIAGVDLSGTITGAKVVYHNEPYILNSRTRERLLDHFLDSLAGHRLFGVNAAMMTPDTVTGATVSARAMRGAILNSARMAYGARVQKRAIHSPTVDAYGFRPSNLAELLEKGSVIRRVFKNGEIQEAFAAAYGEGAKPAVPLGPPDKIFVDLYLALATPPAISRNLLGRDFTMAMEQMPKGGQSIIVASDGPFDFLGDSYRGQSDSYTFIHLRVVQDTQVFRFDRAHHVRLLRREGDGINARRVAAVFYLEADSGFRPLDPWRLEVFVNGTSPSGLASVLLPIEYQLPAQHILLPGRIPPPAWVAAWQEQILEIGIAGVTLCLLTLILIFQAPLVRRRRLHRWVRNGFLLFVLVWLGGIAGAQLSIINIMNYMLAPFRGFDIGFYLAEPIMIMVALYTALTLVLLGRGVFCGWLCPFGALQELLAQMARALRVPQWNPAEAVQKRLWLGKYVAALIVLGLAFFSVEMATTASEVEPFKTAITARFARNWPFVVYAVALLAVGLFTERAFCRFLCPLGGVLALLGRLHLFDHLERRAECGSPCHLCEHSCPVKAITVAGKIDMNECFRCLDCQVEYFDDHRCPPLAQIRKRKLRDAALTGTLAHPSL